MTTTLYIDNEVCIAHCDKTLLSWVCRNLTFPNPEYSKRERLGKWLGSTPREIILYRQEMTIENGLLTYIPYGILNRLEEYARLNKIELQIVDKLNCIERSKIAFPEVPLREYQERAVEKMLESDRGGILQSRAGSGKTQMGLAICQRLGLKTLWLTHTHDLLVQSRTRAEQYFGSELIGTIEAGKVNIGRGITFATVQTMAKLNLSLYKHEWDVIIVDECHRVFGDTTNVRQFQRVLENLSAQYQFGMSATVHRADGLIDTAYCLIGSLTYIVPDEDVKDYVLPISVQPIYTHTKESSEMLNYDGTVDFTKLVNYLTTNEERNKCIANVLIFNSFNSNLILSDRLDHLHELYNLLPPCYQRRSAFIDGSMTTKKGKDQRLQALEDMRNGKINYLFATYKLAKEGLDIPCLDRVYLTTPQKDYAIVVQSIGRVSRTCDGKDKAVVYDFVDDIDYCLHFFKARRRIYQKEGCEIL